MLTVCHQLICPALSLVLSVFQCLCSSQLPAKEWITFFLKNSNSSVQLTVSKGLAISLLNVQFEWVSISNPCSMLIVRLMSWFLKVVLVVLSSKIVAVMMVGVRYNPFPFATIYS